MNKKVCIHMNSIITLLLKKISLFGLLKNSLNTLFRWLLWPTDGSVDKESACNAEDPDSIPGLGRSPEEGNGKPLQHSCLGNPVDRGGRQAIVHGVAESRTRLSIWTTADHVQRESCVCWVALSQSSLPVEAGTTKRRGSGFKREYF